MELDLDEDLLAGGTDPTAVVEDWVVAVEEGIGSRALRLGAIEEKIWG